MQHESPSPPLPEDPIARDIITSTLQACDAAAAVRNHWPTELDSVPATRLLAFGKAGAHMAAAAIERLGTRLSQAAIICPPEHTHLINHPNATAHPADHPLPTERNIAATQALEACARTADPTEPTLVLISGGGSAYLTAPRPGVTLEHIRDTTNRFLRAGADIQELNRHRQQLERLKAGGLLRACASERVIALVLSDVIGNDLGTIASGPLVGEDRGRAAEHIIVGDNRLAVEAAGGAFRDHGLTPRVLDGALVGEASEVGRGLAAMAVESGGCVLGGGETTVTVGGGSGLGGRNLELALSAALAMPADRDWAVLAFATDGVDGPTDAAGAVLTSEMLRDPAARAMGARALAEHDSYHAAERLGGVIRTGATGTNVNDVAAVWMR